MSELNAVGKILKERIADIENKMQTRAGGMECRAQRAGADRPPLSVPIANSSWGRRKSIDFHSD
jgi:hypothetical protein